MYWSHISTTMIAVHKNTINTEESKKRIQAYPCIALHCDEHQYQGNTTQYGSLHHIPNYALQNANHKVY